MKMNDSHPMPDPSPEVEHEEAHVKIHAAPPDVHQSRHISFEVPSGEFAATG